MGHTIVKLDPFNIAGDGHAADSFNPFDLMQFPRENISDESRVLTDLLSVEQMGMSDPFWRIMGQSLLSAVLMFLGGDQEEYPRTISSARQMLFASDFSSEISRLFERNLVGDEARQELEQFLSITDVTQSGILATAKQTMTLFGVEAIKKAFERTTFDLPGVWRGEPISIYVIIPPSKMSAYRQIMRVWLGSFMSLLSTREVMPRERERTLFIVDEAGQLGRLALLEQAITLLRGYGIQMWTFWQELSQIRQHYGDGYYTIVSNCEILEFFSMRNNHAEREVSELIGIDVDDVKSLTRDEMIIVGPERNPVRAYKLDYLIDPEYKDLFDQNPFHPTRV